MPHLWPTGSSLGWPPSITARSSPQALRIPPCDGHPALRSARWLQVRLGRIRLSPSCPGRRLHTFRSLRPARHYPRLWIWRSSFERQRDFNPPEPRAAQHTLSASLTAARSSGLPRLAGLSDLTSHRLNRTALPCSHGTLRLHASGTNPGSIPGHSPCRSLGFCLPHRAIESATSTTMDFGAIFPFTRVPACNLPVYASQCCRSHHARLGTRLRAKLCRGRHLRRLDSMSFQGATLSHPFLARLIGTRRREFLDQVLFWNARDLERKLADFQGYDNAARSHASLEGRTPLTFAGRHLVVTPADLNHVRWVSHCRGLVQLPAAA